MKRLTLLITTCLILWIGFVYFYIRKIDPDELRRLLVYNIEQMLDANFEVGRLEFSGWRSFELRDVGLFRHGKPIIKVKKADVDLSLGGLFQSRLEFSRVQVDGVELFFTRTDTGWNFDRLWIDPSKKIKTRHRPFLSFGADSGENITIGALEVSNGSLHKEGLAAVSFEGSGSLKFPELHLNSLKVGAEKSSVLARLDAHFMDQAVNIWFNDSTFSLSELRDYLEISHSLTGLINLEGGVRWNRDEIDPQLRWRSKELQWAGGTADIKLSYLEGQWDASGIYSLVKLKTNDLEGDANLLIESEPENLFWGNDFQGKVLFQKMRFSGMEQELGGELDFHKSETQVLVKNFHLSSGVVDKLDLDGVYQVETEKLSFQVRGDIQDVKNYVPGLSGSINIAGKGTFSPLVGLELALGGESPGLTIANRQIPSISFQLQSIYRDQQIQFPGLSIHMDRAGNLNFQGMYELSKGFPAGLSGRLSADHLDFSSLTPRQAIKGQGELEVLALSASIKESMVTVHKLKGLAGEGEFSFRGTVGPLDAGFGMPQGKLRLVKMPFGWLNEWIPENIRVDGILDTMGAFQVGVESPGSTKLKLTGTLSSVGMESLEALNILGSADLSDLRSVLPPSWEQLNGIVKLGVSQPDQNLVQGGLYSSELMIPVDTARSPVHTEDVELEFRLHRNPSLGRIKKFSGKVFGGSYRLEGVYEMDGQKTNQFSLDLNRIDVNEFLGFLAPGLRDRASGSLSGRVGFMSFLLPAARDTYPVVMDGFFRVERPKYTVHPLIADMIFYVKRSAQSGILHQILEPGALGMLYESPDLEFQDLERIPFTLSRDVLTLPEMDLRAVGGEFQLVSLSPLALKFPGSEAPHGKVRGEFEIQISSAFLKRVFPRLKNDFEGELKETLRIDGTFKNPLASKEIARIKQSIAQTLIRNSKPRPSKIPAEVELVRLEKNLLSQEERQRLRVESSEYLMKMLSPRKSSRLKDLVSGLVTRSKGATVPESYTEVVDIENQIRNAREKLRSLLQNRF